MHRRHPILAVFLSVVMMAAGVVCCCVRTEAAVVAAAGAAGVSHACCGDPAPVAPGPSQGCDRCEFSAFGGLVSLQPTKAVPIDPPSLVTLFLTPPANLPEIQSFVAANSLTPAPPLPSTLVAMHCQLTL